MMNDKRSTLNAPRSTMTGGLLLFRMRSFEQALLYFVCGALVVGAVTRFFLWVSPAATSHLGWGLANALIAWKIEELSALPEWGRYMVSNGLVVLVIMLVGPLGCAAEAGLRKRSGLYDALGQRTGRPNTLLRFLHSDLGRLASAQARDSVAIALLVPPLAMMVNGAMLGMVGVIFVGQPGATWAQFILLTAPHGIVELVALSLAGSVGMEHADSLLRAALSGIDLVRAAWRRIWNRGTLASALVVLALIAVAAYLEFIGEGLVRSVFGWLFL